MLFTSSGLWNRNPKKAGIETHHLAGRVEHRRRECGAEEADKAQQEDSDGAIVDLQQEGQHRPGQEAARQMHEVCVQQACADMTPPLQPCHVHSLAGM